MLLPGQVRQSSPHHVASCVVAGYGVVVFVLFPHALGATDLGSQFSSAMVRTGSVYDLVQQGVLFLAGAALFGCGVAALTGRMPWKWFWTLGGGIFLIGVAGLVIQQMTGAPTIGLGIF